jgi:hypothetical protein
MRSSLVPPVTAPGPYVTSVLPTFETAEPASTAKGASAGPSTIAEAPWLHAEDGVTGPDPGGPVKAGTVQLAHPHAAKDVKATSAASRRTWKKHGMLSMVMVLSTA